MAGTETAAVSVLKRAVELDKKNRLTEALVCYQEGLALLMDMIKASKSNEGKSRWREKAAQYMDRAEQVKVTIEKQKDTENFHEQIHIEDGSIGHSYDKLFGRFLDEMVTKVEVEDPYLRNHYQLQNFLLFSELLVKKCCNLRMINLLTGQDDSLQSAQEQIKKLDELRHSLESYNVKLLVNFSKTLHDREIRLDSGWVIKIGRGLDIFKSPSSKFSLGYFDRDLRPCFETTVDVFHKKNMKFTDS